MGVVSGYCLPTASHKRHCILRWELGKDLIKSIKILKDPSGRDTEDVRKKRLQAMRNLMNVQSVTKANQDEEDDGEGKTEADGWTVVTHKKTKAKPIVQTATN